jgi:hypothetical protein
MPKFAPVIDGELIQASDRTQHKKDRAANIPILIGFTSDEAGDQSAESLACLMSGSNDSSSL